MLGNPELQETLKRTPKDLKKPAIIHSNGIFVPVIVVDGEVVGTWSRKIEKERAVITLKQYVKLDKDATRGIKDEVERYGSFLGIDAVMK